MEKKFTIKNLQNWDRDFSKRKGINLSEEKLIQMCVLKLIEEVGEVAKALYEKDWKDVQAEICDIITFAVKIANIAEDFHGEKELSDVFKEKIKYSEDRHFNKDTGKFSKPEGYDFK